jgi:hypothetical protein
MVFHQSKRTHSGIIQNNWQNYICVSRSSTFWKAEEMMRDSKLNNNKHLHNLFSAFVTKVNSEAIS